MTRGRMLLAGVVLMEMLHTAVAIAQHRVPTGHDGFQYFTIQYYFLNNAIQSGEAAQWIPYMMQGTVASLWYGIQASFLQSVLLYSHAVPRGMDLLSVFHAGLLVDEMILLIGTWMLARRFFQIPATVFVAISVVGSCVWLDQPYWNFRLYYAIPLVLELGHRFLDTARWRWVFLAGNLLALQALGNLPYFLPIASFVVFAYFALFALLNWTTVRDNLRKLKWNIAAVAAIAAALASFGVVYACVTNGTDQLVSYNPGRLRDGTTTLSGFLTYGGATDVRKWLDLVLNLSPWLDFTVYCGILILPLALCGAIVTDRRRIHFLLLALLMLLFTFGSVISVALFYLWPGMKYFRHIGLVTPLAKVLLCFVAGIGFEWLFDFKEPTRRAARCTAAVAGAALLVCGAWLALSLARSGPALGAFVDSLSTPSVDRPVHTYQHDEVAARLRRSALVAIAGALVLGSVPLLLAVGGLTPRTRRVLQYGVLALVAADVYHFKFAYLFDRSDLVGATARFVTHSAPMTYNVRRVTDLQEAALSQVSPRLMAALAISPMLRLRLQGQVGRGAQYWSNGAFFFTDEAGSTFRVDSWLKPLDQLMRMEWGMPIDDTAELPRGVELDRFRFPLSHPAVRRLAGLDEDKIRFFTNAYSVASPDALAPLLMDPSYAGNLLFVLPVDRGVEQISPVRWASQVTLGADESRRLPYQVQRFDANGLLILVSNTEARPVWLSYADVWHPFWQATVNGRSVPVYRGEMAYKAVPIEPGQNSVLFRFHSPLFSGLSAVAAANALFWLCVCGWMLFDSMRGADAR